MPSFEGRRPTRGRGIQNHEAALGAENQLRVLQAPQVHLGSEVEAGRRATGGEHPCQRRLAALPGPGQDDDPLTPKRPADPGERLGAGDHDIKIS